MYRIENEEDIYELGIEDRMDNGITIIEWNKYNSLTGKIIVVKRLNQGSLSGSLSKCNKT